jgi:hypothetical protein
MSIHTYMIHYSHGNSVTVGFLVATGSTNMTCADLDYSWHICAVWTWSALFGWSYSVYTYFEISLKGGECQNGKVQIERWASPLNKFSVVRDIVTDCYNEMFNLSSSLSCSDLLGGSLAFNSTLITSFENPHLIVIHLLNSYHNSMPSLWALI